MDEALGPPEQMAAQPDELTPMLSQYYELCCQYDDCLLLFQVGDFYEAFCEAAETVSRLLEITLTQREDSTGTYPMAGIPIDNAESYVETLLDAGYRVAIADQVQDSDEATGVVDRAVTRVLTPGTLTEDELLPGDANNFVACLTRGDTAGEAGAANATDDCVEHGTDGDIEYGTDTEFGLALLDVSTGDFVATSADRLDAVADEVSRFGPAEAITDCPAAAEAAFPADCMVSPFDEGAFELDAARDQVGRYFGDPEALLAAPAEIRACGALLSYAEYARGGQVDRLDYLNHLTRYDPREYVLLDAVALRSLELFERRAVHGDEDATLAGVVDDTVTAMGSRQLTEWLRRPLLEPDRIEARHEAVEELVGAVREREALRDHLRHVYDLERLISRIARSRANARDLRSLEETLSTIPDVLDELEGLEAPLLSSLRESIDPLAGVRSLIDDAIVSDPPTEITEGGVIREAYDERLDDLRSTEREGKAWIDDLEAGERERTGIDSLKVGYNSVHGYYIEVTKPNLDRVPEEYQRRQTLKNSERFVTPELKEREEEIVRAEGRADDLEHDLFREVRSSVADESARIQRLADALATLDALSAFAEVAATQDYCRPEIVDERRIEIEDGRHPIVERRQPEFVPNDAMLTPAERFAVITGPNMSGKSTYMRQVALIVVLAQAGSFVPAASATIGPVDRVFTRVGASDDIAGGRSTFMVEMLEVAEILSGATESSLVLLDEVGRGTSTADGLAIAQALAEHLHDEIGAFTLFATHHHDLTETADRLSGAVNLHFDATKSDGEIDFEHDVGRGPAEASYGVEVAGEAGVDSAVVERARELLADSRAGKAVDAPAAGAGRDVDVLAADAGKGVDAPASSAGDEEPAIDGDEEATTGERAASQSPTAGDTDDSSTGDQPPTAITSGGADLDEDTAAALAAMRETDVATLTPIEALNRLAEIKDRLD